MAWFPRQHSTTKRWSTYSKPATVMCTSHIPRARCYSTSLVIVLVITDRAEDNWVRRFPRSTLLIMRNAEPVLTLRKSPHPTSQWGRDTRFVYAVAYGAVIHIHEARASSRSNCLCLSYACSVVYANTPSFFGRRYSQKIHLAHWDLPGLRWPYTKPPAFVMVCGCVLCVGSCSKTMVELSHHEPSDFLSIGTVLTRCISSL